MTFLTGCGSKDTVKIGHKNYTEQRILGQMFALMIENHTDYKTDITELGGTSVNFQALKGDQIMVYPEFTGTGYAVMLGETEMRDPQKIYDYLQKRFNEDYNITWLAPLGYNNTYTLTMRKEDAERLGVTTISDLVPHTKDLIIGAEAEFLERIDGLAGVKNVYTMGEFKEEVSMESGLIYSALVNGDIDINDAFSTDGRIKKFDLYTLEDDQHAFLPYYVSPLVNETLLKDFPEAVDALNMLENQFTDEEMQVLNLAVDEGEKPRDVAEKILKEKGLIK